LACLRFLIENHYAHDVNTVTASLLRLPFIAGCKLSPLLTNVTKTFKFQNIIKKKINVWNLGRFGTIKFNCDKNLSQNNHLMS